MQRPTGHVPLARRIRATAGRSTTAKVSLFILAAYVFLWVPDLDFLLLEVLHHRSIVTHSILPALVLIVMGWKAGAAPIAGALVGLAVHLSCDMLSPMVGFAQIWLPEPIKMPLGPLSYLWLGLNALLAFIWSRRIAARTLPAPFGGILVAGTGIITAVSYGWLNEGAIWPITITMVIFLLSYVGPFVRMRSQIEKDRQKDPQIERSGSR